MAKDKDRALNPAAAQRKADKAKAVKKARNEKQTQRPEKLARRNPDRIQRPIDDLKALETAGDIKPREQAILAELERDLKAVRKARDALGESSQTAGNRDRPPRDFGKRDGDRAHNANHTVLGKRRHNGERSGNDAFSSGEETDESVRNIPMPRDTPPPIPRARMPYSNRHGNSANSEQGSQVENSSSQPHGLPPRPSPAVQAQTTYSSAPQLRDLKKEAVSRFVPTAVKQKQNAIHGMGTLLEPEELDRLEQAGYLNGSAPPAANTNEDSRSEQTTDEDRQRLAEEEARFERELALEAAANNEDMDIDSRNNDTPSNTTTVPTIDTTPAIHTTQYSNKINPPAPISKLTSGPLLSSYYGDDEEEDENSTITATASLPPNTANILPTTHPRTAQQSKGLFASLPKPKRQVEMEEVDDEDL